MKKRVLAISLGLVIMFSSVTSVSANSYLDFGWYLPVQHPNTAISCSYGCYSGHYGVDLIVNTPTDIHATLYAAKGGLVVESYYQLLYRGGPTTCTINGITYDRYNYGYGYLVAVKTNDIHSNGHPYVYAYAHLYHMPRDRYGRIIYRYNNVSTGDPVGRMGNTGCSTGTHLHMQVGIDGTWAISPNAGNTIDPMLFYNGRYFLGNASPPLQNSLDNNVNQSLSSQNNEIYKVDVSLIEYVGEENFFDWLDEGRGKDESLVTVIDFLNEFEISTAKCKELVEGKSKYATAPFAYNAEKNDFYDYEMIEAVR